MSDKNMRQSQYVKLNVGGRLFQTTIATLSSKDSMLRTVFTGSMESHADTEGWIFIDRCGKHFDTILNYLRDGSVALPDNERDITELLAEAQYYLIEDLILLCQQALDKKKEPVPISRVLMLSSRQEVEALIASTSKPIIKLTINKSKNQCPYDINSPETYFMMNIELFFNLSQKFGNQGYFIIDTNSESGVVCGWSFFGQGRKCADIDCFSYRQATDGKYRTFIEVPEAKITEEALALFLKCFSIEDYL